MLTWAVFCSVLFSGTPQISQARRHRVIFYSSCCSTLIYSTCHQVQSPVNATWIEPFLSNLTVAIADQAFIPRFRIYTHPLFSSLPFSVHPGNGPWAPLLRLRLSASQSCLLSSGFQGLIWFLSVHLTSLDPSPHARHPMLFKPLSACPNLVLPALSSPITFLPTPTILTEILVFEHSQHCFIIQHLFI